MGNPFNKPKHTPWFQSALCTILMEEIVCILSFATCVTVDLTAKESLIVAVIHKHGGTTSQVQEHPLSQIQFPGQITIYTTFASTREPTNISVQWDLLKFLKLANRKWCRYEILSDSLVLMSYRNILEARDSKTWGSKLSIIHFRHISSALQLIDNGQSG